MPNFWVTSFAVNLTIKTHKNLQFVQLRSVAINASVAPFHYQCYQLFQFYGKMATFLRINFEVHYGNLAFCKIDLKLKFDVMAFLKKNVQVSNR